MPAGYSKTPLSKKLGIKSGYKMLLFNAPDNYYSLLIDLPEDVKKIDKAESKSADFIHLFFQFKSDLEAKVPLYKKALKMDGMLWISWPKGSSKIETDINRDLIRTYVLEQGLVDTKVVAFDEDWSGLKFVYRLKDRK